jgi:hypothetical protein
MKIISERPLPQKQCYYCCSILELELDDVTAYVDIISGHINPGAPDLMIRWKCSVCGQSNGEWLKSSLPPNWRTELVKRFCPEEQRRYAVFLRRNREECEAYTVK